MARITGNSNFVGVFGHPVGHTLSPPMHNAAFAALGMDWHYLAFDIPPEKLTQALRALPVLGIRGMNLTIPHKEAGAKAMDELSPFARLLGAINTVQVLEDKLIGHNTDGIGILYALREAKVEIAGEKVVLLGAGGAAHTIAFALATEGISSLVVANRTVTRAEALARKLKVAAPAVEITPRGLSDFELQKEVESAGLVVNATSVGMYPRAEVPSPLPANWLHAGQTVVDIVYRPTLTRLLREAEERGCRTLNGVKMLVWQGAESFTLWTGREAPVEVMEKALKGTLDEQEASGK